MRLRALALAGGLPIQQSGGNIASNTHSPDRSKLGSFSSHYRRPTRANGERYSARKRQFSLI